MPNHGHRLRDRTSGATLSTRSSLGSTSRLYSSNILPTPDPTVASCISDEDVALQLMRLGEVSHFSHGRTSASTLDDALSGRAEAASSATSDSESESDGAEGHQLPPGNVTVKTELDIETVSTMKKQRRLDDNGGELSGDDVDADYREGLHSDEIDGQSKSRPRAIKSKKIRAGSASTKASKSSKQGNVVKKSKSMGFQPPMSPASLPTQSRKVSSASTINFQHQLGVDEDDLSSKPRCQRCRKSKKGCDRERPCQRCKDAGIGIDGCVSEDEGNGRKGRYGRHMGVPVKKDADGMSIDEEFETASAILSGMASGHPSPEKSKKRKR